MVLLRLRFQKKKSFDIRKFFFHQVWEIFFLTLFRISPVLPRATQTDLGFLTRWRLFTKFCLWIRFFFQTYLTAYNSYIIIIAFNWRINITKLVHCSNINDKHFILYFILTSPPYKIKTKQVWKFLDPDWNFPYNHYKISAQDWNLLCNEPLSRGYFMMLDMASIEIIF